jgi:hypothetical protein
MKKCLISFSSQGRENYNKAMLNLIKSTKNYWDGDYLMYSLDGYADEYMGVKINLGSYPYPERFSDRNNHAEVPYQFKSNLFQMAREKGYDQVVWCDSTIRMTTNPEALLQHANKHGLAVFDNLGHPLKYWISDICVERLGLTPDELEVCPQIMACVIIFDFTTEKGNKVFERWLAASRDGVSFQNGYGSKREGFKAHRHDQATLSGICFQEGVPLLPYGKLVYPPHDKTKEYGEDIFFINKGVI